MSGFEALDALRAERDALAARLAAAEKALRDIAEGGPHGAGRTVTAREVARAALAGESQDFACRDPKLHQRDSLEGGALNVYLAKTRRASVGWITYVVWRPKYDGIGLSGPTFWRPTRRWVEARAQRHIDGRLRLHERDARSVRCRLWSPVAVRRRRRESRARSGGCAGC